jgi:hypothetical protein
MPPGQLVHETLPDPKSTDEEDDREEEGLESFCYFSSGVRPVRPQEDEDEPERVFEVTPKLDSGGTTHTKPRPVPAPNVRACSKSPPTRLKIKRLKSPSGDTPGREAVVRQNAAASDLMDEEVQRWAVAAAASEPRNELFH